MRRTIPTSLGHSTQIDSTGGVGSIRKNQVPPNHPQIQSEARNLGRDVMADFKRGSPQEQQANINTLKGAADEAERIGARSGSVPANHKRKLDAYLEQPDPKKFRTMTNNQDEMTQSGRTTAFMQGMQERSAPYAKGSQSKDHEFQRESARLMSSMRAPTDTVSAPLDVGGRQVGTRHPTSNTAVPTSGWTGHASAHSDADRRRADLVNSSGRSQLNQGGPAAPANSVLAQAQAGGRYTLESMSLPYEARNVNSAGFKPSGDQTKQREGVKEQVNMLSNTLGIPPQTNTQGRTDPALPYDAPTSPLRV